MNNLTLSAPSNLSFKRAFRLAFLALLMAFCGTAVAQQDSVPFKLEEGTTYVCQPIQGHPYCIKVAEVKGTWVKGEITAYPVGNTKVLPERGSGWINLRNVFFIMEEKR